MATLALLALGGHCSVKLSHRPESALAPEGQRAFWSGDVRTWAAKPGPRPPLKLPADPPRANYLVFFCQVKTIILALFDVQVGENQARTGVCCIG